MRIVLTHPFCWPYVRRGSERFIAEMAKYLVGQGHEVLTVSSKPGAGRVERTEHGKRILHRQFWHPLMARARIQPAHTFAMACMASLARIDADVVHSLAYFDAWAANLLRRVRRYHTVYQVTGPAVPHHFPRIPPDRFVLRDAIRRSDRILAHSEFTARIVREYYGREVAVIPVPIDLDAFPVRDVAACDRPILLCVASFAERRKGLRVMLRAFELLKSRLPDAVLRLSGHMPAEVRREWIDPLPEKVRRDIEVLDIGKLGDMSRLYREASLTVLPSMWEAYGMVVVESWASGTPVVVTDHGGLGELVTDPALGLRFDPQTDGQETMNAEGLAEAIVAALPLAERSDTRHRCRARAERYTWAVLGPEYEKLYRLKTAAGTAAERLDSSPLGARGVS